MVYSIELRERVISYVESGGSRNYASIIFCISERTIRNWISLKKESGSVSPRAHGGGYPAKIDLVALKASVDSDSNKTLEELGKEFSVCAVSVWQALQKIGYVYKKNTSLQRARRRKKS